MDKRHLQCFFTWEKQEGANRLTITETFYDNPKAFEDTRKGVHTTLLGEMMQNLILATDWTELYISRGWTAPYFSKRGMLLSMGLIPPTKTSGLKTDAEWDYQGKIYQLLDSAITQLNKKGDADIVPVLTNRAATYVFSFEDADIEKYRDIKQAVCEELGVRSVVGIYRRHIEDEFWKGVDKAASKEFKQKGLVERLAVRTPHPKNVPEVNKQELIQLVVENIYSNYERRQRGAIGTRSPEFYLNELNQVISRL